MSVFTKVTPEDLRAWLKGYVVGNLVELQGITAGIENTNYFVTTAHGRYVLTLFERLSESELPFYLDLMAHLARHGIPCPAPIANQANEFLGRLNGKPATLVTCLPGKAVTAPGTAHCEQIGATLAEMHLAAQSFHGKFPNPRGQDWWRATAPRVLPFLDAPRRMLLESELEFQAGQDRTSLPRGAVHADLFRDNALWEGSTESPRLGGVIDFYFAGVDTLAYDVAVTMNDWCLREDARFDPARARALIGAYRQIREFTEAERAAWPAIVRAAALRFWLSRLFDFHLPRPGELIHAHDPEHFRRVLETRREHMEELAHYGG
jgi:homoserine kinase type II